MAAATDIRAEDSVTSFIKLPDAKNTNQSIKNTSK